MDGWIGETDEGVPFTAITVVTGLAAADGHKKR